MSTVDRSSLTVPAAERRADAPPAATGGDRGWQLAMERAQTRQWFHGALGQGPGPAFDAPAAGQPASKVAGTSPERLAPEASPRHARDAATREGGRGSAPAAAAHNFAATGTPAATALALRSLATTAAVPAAAMSSDAVDAAPSPRYEPASARIPALQSPGVRVHVEAGPQGLHVWLGVDGDAAAVAARAQAVLAELRRGLGASAPRLALVVCNGETLFASPAAGTHVPAAPVSFLPEQEP